MTVALINIVSGVTAGGLILSAALKGQDGKMITAVVRFALGIWILALAVEAAT